MRRKGLVQGTGEGILTAQGQIAWLKRRIVELEGEAATLPTVGFHRAAYVRTRKTLKHVRRALEEEQEYLEWLEGLLDQDIELEKELNVQMQERLRRAEEADRRRAAFRLIQGGKP